MLAPDREWLGFTKYQSMNGFPAPQPKRPTMTSEAGRVQRCGKDNFIDKHWKRRIEIEKYIRGNTEHSDSRQPEANGHGPGKPPGS